MLSQLFLFKKKCKNCLPSWIFHKLIAQWWPHFISCSPSVCLHMLFLLPGAPFPSNLSRANFNSSCKVQLSNHLLQGVIHSNPGLHAESQGFFSWPLEDSLAVSAPCCTLRSGTRSYSPLYPPCPDWYPTCYYELKTVLGEWIKNFMYKWGHPGVWPRAQMLEPACLGPTSIFHHLQALWL